MQSDAKPRLSSRRLLRSISTVRLYLYGQCEGQTEEECCRQFYLKSIGEGTNCDGSTIECDPEVEITYPTQNSVFAENCDITVTADADCDNSNIEEVEFYVDGNSVGKDTG